MIPDARQVCMNSAFSCHFRVLSLYTSELMLYLIGGSVNKVVEAAADKSLAL
jgi:hypothetical protein